MATDDVHLMETAGREPNGVVGLDDNPELGFAGKPTVFLRCSSPCDTDTAAGPVGWERTPPYPPERQEEPRA